MANKTKKVKMVFLDCCDGIEVPWEPHTIFYDCPECGANKAGSTAVSNADWDAERRMEDLMLHGID